MPANPASPFQLLLLQTQAAEAKLARCREALRAMYELRYQMAKRIEDPKVEAALSKAEAALNTI